MKRTFTASILGLLKTIAGTTSLLLVASACLTAKKDGALKYGYLIDSKELFVYLPDGAEIRQCGGPTEMLNWAVNTWGAAIGRSYAVISDCVNPDIKFYDRESAYALEECGAASLYGRLFAKYWRVPREIVTCPGAELTRIALLHEVGHLFGLCDQYESAIGNCAFTTPAANGSVMQTADKDFLTPDDENGIKSLAQQVTLTKEPIKLLSGNYSEDPAGQNIWNIAVEATGNRSYTIEIVVSTKAHTARCQKYNNLCNYNNGTLKILSNKHFSYETDGITTDFYWQGKQTSDGGGSANQPATSPGADRLSQDQRAYINRGAKTPCTVAPSRCDINEPKEKNLCYCQFYISCHDMEIPSFCAAP